MRFVYHYRQPFRRQIALLEAIQVGAWIHGDVIEGEAGFDKVRDVDGLVLFGIGGISRSIYDAYRNAGKRVVFLDKGYTSRSQLFRVVVDGFQPLKFVDTARCPQERFQALQVALQPYKGDGEYLLFDGASNKYCLWQGLGDWVMWGRKMVSVLAEHTKLPILYRVRPSHNPSPPAPPGSTLSSMEPLVDAFAKAKIVVSYGGNIGWDAVVAGKPHFALGDSVARVLSQTDLSKLDEPYIPGEIARLQWAANVAYCQWTLGEIRNGQAWKHIKTQF